LEKEIVLAIHEGDLDGALDKVKTWGSIIDHFMGSPPEAPRDAFVERLKEALHESWNTKIEEAIKNSLAESASTAQTCDT
jgi:hypothetical protein